MKNLEDASKVLLDNLTFALTHSMDLKSDGIDPMIPFAIVINRNNKSMRAFAGDSPEYADSMFEKTIKEEDPDIVVYAYDGFLTTNGIKYDAVIFEAYERDESEIYIAGQKYIPKTEAQDFEKIGNPSHLGSEPNKFLLLNKDRSEKKKPWWRF